MNNLLSQNVDSDNRVSILLSSVLTSALLAVLLSTGVAKAQTPHGSVTLEMNQRDGDTTPSGFAYLEWKDGTV